VIGIDPVPERRATAKRHGVETIDPDAVEDPATKLQTDPLGYEMFQAKRDGAIKVVLTP
jgi:hypothetical protein